MEGRYSARIPVECSVVFAGEALSGEGRVIDVSLPGCLMESSESPKPGDYVQLKLFLPDQQPAVRVSLAVVRWAEGSRVGVEFIRSSKDDQARLTRFNAVAEVVHRPSGMEGLKSSRLPKKSSGGQFFSAMFLPGHPHILYTLSAWVRRPDDRSVLSTSGGKSGLHGQGAG